MRSCNMYAVTYVSPTLLNNTLWWPLTICFNLLFMVFCCSLPVLSGQCLVHQPGTSVVKRRFRVVTGSNLKNLLACVYRWLGKCFWCVALPGLRAHFSSFVKGNKYMNSPIHCIIFCGLSVRLYNRLYYVELLFRTLFSFIWNFRRLLTLLHR